MAGYVFDFMFYYGCEVVIGFYDVENVFVKIDFVVWQDLGIDGIVVENYEFLVYVVLVGCVNDMLVYMVEVVCIVGIVQYVFVLYVVVLGLVG